MKDQKIKVGLVITNKVDVLDNPVGTYGICYEVYSIRKISGGSFIFENGAYDGFSLTEIEDFLNIKCVIPLDYKFSNVIKLTEDFRKGIFKTAIDKYRHEAGLPNNSQQD